MCVSLQRRVRPCQSSARLQARQQPGTKGRGKYAGQLLHMVMCFSRRLPARRSASPHSGQQGPAPARARRRCCSWPWAPACAAWRAPGARGAASARSTPPGRPPPASPSTRRAGRARARSRSRPPRRASRSSSCRAPPCDPGPQARPSRQSSSAKGALVSCMTLYISSSFLL